MKKIKYSFLILCTLSTCLSSGTTPKPISSGVIDKAPAGRGNTTNNLDRPPSGIHDAYGRLGEGPQWLLGNIPPPPGLSLPTLAYRSEIITPPPGGSPLSQSDQRSQSSTFAPVFASSPHEPCDDRQQQTPFNLDATSSDQMADSSSHISTQPARPRENSRAPLKATCLINALGLMPSMILPLPVGEKKIQSSSQSSSSDNSRQWSEISNALPLAISDALSEFRSWSWPSRVLLPNVVEYTIWCAGTYVNVPVSMNGSVFNELKQHQNFLLFRLLPNQIPFFNVAAGVHKLGFKARIQKAGPCHMSQQADELLRLMTNFDSELQRSLQRSASNRNSYKNRAAEIAFLDHVKGVADMIGHWLIEISTQQWNEVRDKLPLFFLNDAGISKAEWSRISTEPRELEQRLVEIYSILNFPQNKTFALERSAFANLAKELTTLKKGITALSQRTNAHLSMKSVLFFIDAVRKIKNVSENGIQQLRNS